MESLTVLKQSSLIERASRAQKGFTLVEMLVVLGIISIITTVAVTGQSTFNQNLLLTNTAYTVAFSAREAQSFGLSSRKFGSVQNAGYGLHFDRSLLTSYILFADTSPTAAIPASCPVGSATGPDHKPGNCVYDSSAPADGVVERFTFARGFKIQKFCGIVPGGTPPTNKLCSTDSSPLTSLDVVFTRPNTSSTITGYVGGLQRDFSCAEITITDSRSVTTKAVRISKLGEISIGQTCS